jgi:nucleotide-binding universal stress UspA family protein
MSEDTTRPSVLVPVDVSTDERPDPQLLELLEPARVVLGGWYPVPDQTLPEQLREAHEEEAIERIEAIAAAFSDADAAVETVVVFTRDRSTTVDRLADEYECGVVLVPRTVRRVERVLVPLRTDVNLSAILSVVGALLRDSEATVTLLHAAEAEEAAETGERLLRSGADELLDAGVDAGRIDTVSLESGALIDDIVDVAANHDVLVIGESEPSLIEHVLGDVPDQLISRTDRPVLIVRKPPAEEEAGREETDATESVGDRS